MTVRAAAITTIHPPSDPERFDRWVAGCLASARHSPGYVIGRKSVQGRTQLDGHRPADGLGARRL